MSETKARRAAVMRVFARSQRIAELLRIDVLADDVAEGAYIPPGKLIPLVERIGERMPGSPMIATWLRELQRQLADPEPPPLDHDPEDVANTTTELHAAGNHAAGHSRPSRASRK